MTKYKITTREDQEVFGRTVPAGSTIVVDAAWFEPIKALVSDELLANYDIEQIEVE